MPHGPSFLLGLGQPNGDQTTGHKTAAFFQTVGVLHLPCHLFPETECFQEGVACTGPFCSRVWPKPAI